MSKKYATYDEVPYYRKQGFFWLMWFLFGPVAIAILLSGDVYYFKKGEVRNFGWVNKIIAMIFLLPWMAEIVHVIFYQHQ